MVYTHHNRHKHRSHINITDNRTYTLASTFIVLLEYSYIARRSDSLLVSFYSSVGHW
jgi:hypothetical protein